MQALKPPPSSEGEPLLFGKISTLQNLTLLKVGFDQ